MAPKRILITGGGGFAGRHLRVALGDRFPEADLLATGEREQPGIRPLDVTDEAAAGAVMKEFRPDAVIHLAAISAVPAANRDAGRAWRVNLGGTGRLARAVLEFAPDAFFLFVSSAAV
ncbi:MAG: NAD-dependent epimerase/dehydratase family protein, partial [Acetobacteraceae bacterium]